MLTVAVNMSRKKVATSGKVQILRPESVEIMVQGKKKGFRIRHQLAVMGFDKEKYPDKEDVAIRVKSLLNLIKLTGVPSKDFSA